MEKCNDCWLYKRKNTKERPYTCAKCEFICHCETLKSSIAATWIGKLPYKTIDWLDRILKMIYDFVHMC